MAFLKLPCGTTIHYKIQGTGPMNVLLLAPGGMKSAMDVWNNHAYNPWFALPPDRFRLIGMDQRNASDLSVGPIGSGWDTYRDDQLALLDHLGVSRDGDCLIVGSCIGPAFGLNLLKHAPDRFAAAVLLQPIGLAHHTTEQGEKWDGLNYGKRKSFVAWSEEMIQKGRFAQTELDCLHEQMYGRTKEFCFSVTEEDATKIHHPLLVLMGKDKSHPSETSRQLARMAPRATLVEKWRDGDDAPENVQKRIEEFLTHHYNQEKVNKREN